MSYGPRHNKWLLYMLLDWEMHCQRKVIWGVPDHPLDNVENEDSCDTTIEEKEQLAFVSAGSAEMVESRW